MPVTIASSDEAADQRQRHPVRDRHGEEVARGGERHQRREQQQPIASVSIADHCHDARAL